MPHDFPQGNRNAPGFLNQKRSKETDILHDPRSLSEKLAQTEDSDGPRPKPTFSVIDVAYTKDRKFLICTFDHMALYQKDIKEFKHMPVTPSALARVIDLVTNLPSGADVQFQWHHTLSAKEVPWVFDRMLTFPNQLFFQFKKAEPKPYPLFGDRGC